MKVLANIDISSLPEKEKIIMEAAKKEVTKMKATITRRDNTIEKMKRDLRNTKTKLDAAEKELKLRRHDTSEEVSRFIGIMCDLIEATQRERETWRSYY